VQSNYGGWAFTSGLGPGKISAFNTTLQSTKFDSEGAYIRKWVTELANVPNVFIHDPWNMPAKMMKEIGFKLVDEVSDEKGTYPKPIACEKYTSLDAAKKVKRSN
jgi:deoxyribodipyrimidine photolyase